MILNARHIRRQCRTTPPNMYIRLRHSVTKATLLVGGGGVLLYKYVDVILDTTIEVWSAIRVNENLDKQPTLPRHHHFKNTKLSDHFFGGRWHCLALFLFALLRGFTLSLSIFFRKQRKYLTSTLHTEYAEFLSLRWL